MIKKAIYKVPNGKLLKIFLEDDVAPPGTPRHIVSIKITGDFFMHPEENVEHLEAALAGCELTQAALTKCINDFLLATPTTFFGLDTESLVTTFLSAQ